MDTSAGGVAISRVGRHELVCHEIRRLAEMFGYETEEFNPGTTSGPDLLLRSPSGEQVIIEVENAYAQNQDAKWKAYAQTIGQEGRPVAIVVVGPEHHHREFNDEWKAAGGGRTRRGLVRHPRRRLASRLAGSSRAVPATGPTSPTTGRLGLRILQLPRVGYEL